VELRYLYIGTSDTEADLVAWLAVPGAELRWRFRRFGADVACVDPGSGPAVMLADHRPAGSVLPIFAVASLDEADALDQNGWALVETGVEVPEGPVAMLRSVDGAELALLRVDRPGAMEASYRDPSNTFAVHPPEG
jgi:hypothetical protein